MVSKSCMEGGKVDKFRNLNFTVYFWLAVYYSQEGFKLAGIVFELKLAI